MELVRQQAFERLMDQIVKGNNVLDTSNGSDVNFADYSAWHTQTLVLLDHFPSSFKRYIYEFENQKENTLKGAKECIAILGRLGQDLPTYWIEPDKNEIITEQYDSEIIEKITHQIDIGNNNILTTIANCPIKAYVDSSVYVAWHTQTLTLLDHLSLSTMRYTLEIKDNKLHMLKNVSASINLLKCLSEDIKNGIVTQKIK